jgi:2'-5' RNA ligase
MKELKVSIPGYQVNEYLLVLSPHSVLCEKIKEIKESFSQEFKAPTAKYTNPHIPLVHFVNWSMMEERIISRLDAIAAGIEPIKVELKDFGSFPSHTIFINVLSKLPIQGLVKELKTAQRLLKLDNENKPHFIDEPHLTICRKLKPWQYEESWLKYSHLHFTARFIADGMQLLKRPVGEKKGYSVSKEIKFLNLPVKTEQGNLFA